MTTTPDPTTRHTASSITEAALAALYDERDRVLTALKRIGDRRKNPLPLDLLGVRRYSEPGGTTPVVIDGRAACGVVSDHVRRGCIGLSYTDRRGGYGLIHLTPQDAARLADLLRAMTAHDTQETETR